MTPESMVQLAGSGNTSTVEDEWMKLLEKVDLTASKLKSYAKVLLKLVQEGNIEEADTLAVTTYEAVSDKFDPADVLAIAVEFLLALGNESSTRKQVADMFREQHGDVEELDALIAEAGLEKGRPVRRALRTMDVCLRLEGGAFAVERHEDGAARVEAVDKPEWEIHFSTRRRNESLGAVQFADRFAPAKVEDFRVLYEFEPDKLESMLQDDPVNVVMELCRSFGDTMDSDQLEMALVPGLLTEPEWKKWWTKARTALRKCPNIKIAGRNPYEISYVQESAHEEVFLSGFDKVYEPEKKLALLEQHIKERSQHGAEVDQSVRGDCYEKILRRANKDAKRKEQTRLSAWLVACRVGELAGKEDVDEGALSTLRESEDLKPLFVAIEDNSLLLLGFEKLLKARPDDGAKLLADLLPIMPTAVCDNLVEMLVKSEFGKESFDAIVAKIMDVPLRHNDALLWLWDGPKHSRFVETPPLLVMLSTILGVLEECQRNDQIDKGIARKISQRSRAVLSARKYEKYKACIDELNRGVAMTLRTQIRRLDNLGRTVHMDLQRVIQDKFPPAVEPVEVIPWERDDVLYVTPAGMDKKQKEIDHHVKVKMKENSIRIGEAAALGDLSENSEYKFALEERDLLQARLSQMTSEMNKAEVLNREEISTELITVGTRVRFERIDSGEIFEVSVVGPWMANLDMGYINYKTPFAQSFLGRKVGDRVQLDVDQARGNFEIKLIENALTVDDTLRIGADEPTQVAD